MKVVILAGGFGLRLIEETDLKLKPREAEYNKLERESEELTRKMV